MGGCFSSDPKRFPQNPNLPSQYLPPNPPPPFTPVPPIPSSDQSAAAGGHMSRLPYAHVDAKLRALAGQAEGFGRQAVGGAHGAVYHVTSLAGMDLLSVIRVLVFG